MPHTFHFDVVGYGCTSASAVIGSKTVAAQIRTGLRARHVTDPLTATQAALKALGIRKLGFLSPHVETVSARMRAQLETGQTRITAFGSFGEQSDERIARLEGASIRAAARQMAGLAACDGVFMSCTNLRAVAEIPALEADLGMHVLCSNQTLAWHMLRLDGQPTSAIPCGALMQTP